MSTSPSLSKGSRRGNIGFWLDKPDQIIERIALIKGTRGAEDTGATIAATTIASTEVPEEEVSTTWGFFLFFLTTSSVVANWGILLDRFLDWQSWRRHKRHCLTRLASFLDFSWALFFGQKMASVWQIWGHRVVLPKQTYKKENKHISKMEISWK